MRSGPAPASGTSGSDIDALLAAVAELAGGAPPPVPYEQEPATGDFFPVTDEPGWRDAAPRARGRLLTRMTGSGPVRPLPGPDELAGATYDHPMPWSTRR